MGSRDFGVRLAVITVIGGLWRLGYLFAVKIDDDLLLNDSLYFSIQAGRNSQGAWFREGLTELPGAEHGPLTSLYLTPWSLVGDDIVAWQRFAMTLIGITTVAVVGLVGRRLAGPRAGLVAAAIAAVYPNLWINDSLVMSESLACLIVAVALLVALGFDREPSLGRAAALGVVVGLGALTRSEIALYAVGFAGLAWWRGAGHPRRALLPVIVLSAATLTVMPWTLYNVARFDRPVLLSTNDGGTLIGANCDSTYYEDIGGWDIGCLTPIAADGAADDAVDEAADAAVDGTFAEPADTSVRSIAWRDSAIDYVGNHTSRVPIVLAARLGRIVDLYGLGSLVRLDRGEEKAHWAVWAGIVAWWVLAITAIVGWLALGRPGDGSPERSRARWWLAVPVAAVLVTTVVFYGSHRIRAPAEPVVVVLAAVGAVALWGRRPVRS